jgi:hypothetical protein
MRPTVAMATAWHLARNAGRTALRTVEAVNLVDDEQRSHSLRNTCASNIEGFLEIGNTREDGGKLLQLDLGLAREEARDRSSDPDSWKCMRGHLGKR